MLAMAGRYDPALDVEKVRKQGQEALVAFLKTDLDLGFTFARTAEIDNPDDPHAIQAWGKARKVVETVRCFAERIDDQNVRQAICKRADELQDRIPHTS